MTFETLTDQEAAEADPFLAICRGQRPPDPEAFATGRAAWEAGLAFHEGPRPMHTVKGLSWRLGWNERALEER